MIKYIMHLRGFWTALVGIILFFVGLIVGRFFLGSSSLLHNVSHTNIVSFNPPQVTLPDNWFAKESLPGNSFETAFTLLTGIQTQGTLNENNAIDYYVFTLKDPSKVIIDVTNVPKSLYWVIYDSKQKEIASAYRTGTTSGSTQILMQNPGKYYVKVWADYQELANYPYTIRLNVLPYFD